MPRTTRKTYTLNFGCFELSFSALVNKQLFKNPNQKLFKKLYKRGVSRVIHRLVPHKPFRGSVWCGHPLLHALGVAQSLALQLTSVLHDSGGQAAAGGDNISGETTVNSGLLTNLLAPQAINVGETVVDATVDTHGSIVGSATNRSEFFGDHITRKSESCLVVVGKHTVADSQAPTTTNSIEKDGEVIEQAEQASGIGHVEEEVGFEKK